MRLSLGISILMGVEEGIGQLVSNIIIIHMSSSFLMILFLLGYEFRRVGIKVITLIKKVDLRLHLSWVRVILLILTIKLSIEVRLIIQRTTNLIKVRLIKRHSLLLLREWLLIVVFHVLIVLDTNVVHKLCWLGEALNILLKLSLSKIPGWHKHLLEFFKWKDFLRIRKGGEIWIRNILVLELLVKLILIVYLIVERHCWLTIHLVLLVAKVSRLEERILTLSIIKLIVEIWLNLICHIIVKVSHVILDWVAWNKRGIINRDIFIFWRTFIGNSNTALYLLAHNLYLAILTKSFFNGFLFCKSNKAKSSRFPRNLFHHYLWLGYSTILLKVFFKYSFSWLIRQPLNDNL